jgi:hypothetical protein
MNNKPIWTVAIDPQALYDDDSLVRGLHIAQGVVDEARREGCLKSIRVGKRTLLRGQAILEWLSGLEAPPGPASGLMPEAAGECTSPAAHLAQEHEAAREWEAEVEALKQRSPRYLAWLDQKVANLNRELELLHELASKPSAASDPEVGFFIKVARSRLHSYLSEFVGRTDAANDMDGHRD